MIKLVTNRHFSKYLLSSSICSTCSTCTTCTTSLVRNKRFIYICKISFKESANFTIFYSNIMFGFKKRRSQKIGNLQNQIWIRRKISFLWHEHSWRRLDCDSKTWWFWQRWRFLFEKLDGIQKWIWKSKQRVMDRIGINVSAFKCGARAGMYNNRL